jgi:hypothetical protein
MNGLNSARSFGVAREERAGQDFTARRRKRSVAMRFIGRITLIAFDLGVFYLFVELLARLLPAR